MPAFQRGIEVPVPGLAPCSSGRKRRAAPAFPACRPRGQMLWRLLVGRGAPPAVRTEAGGPGCAERAPVDRRRAC